MDFAPLEKIQCFYYANYNIKGGMALRVVQDSCGRLPGTYLPGMSIFFICKMSLGY